MAQENEDTQIEESNTDEGQVEEETGEAPEDKPEEKPQESLEQKEARLKRQLTQIQKKLGRDADEPRAERPEPKKTKSDDLDYGQLAYLEVKGIKGEEVDLAKEVMEATGQTLRQVIDSRHFQGMLKERRDERSIEDATPTNSKRTQSSARNKVDYWIQKGEIPPNTPENQQLRRDYVNAKSAQESKAKQFTDHPVG